MTVRALLWLGAGLFCFGLIALLARQAPGLPVAPLPAYVLAFLLVSAEILLLARLAPPRGAWLWGVVLSSVALLSLVAGARLTGESAGLASAALLWVATGLGAAIGTRIEKAGHLCAVVVVSSLADLWSVYDPSGPSAALAREVAAHPDVVPAFALCFPLLGSPHIPAIIGAGDVLFCALYLAVFERHGLPLKRALWALSAGFVLGLLGLLWLERPLPLLPVLGGALLLADRRTCSLDARERRSVGVVVLLLIALLVVRFTR